MWSVGAAYAVGDWLPRAIAHYYLQPTWVGIAFFLGVASFMAAPYYMAFAAVYRGLARSFDVESVPYLAWRVARASLAAGDLPSADVRGSQLAPTDYKVQ